MSDSYEAILERSRARSPRDQVVFKARSLKSLLRRDYLTPQWRDGLERELREHCAIYQITEDELR
jgi:hypothetical protein